ncbi:MAG: bifunctional pyr operon transcriptional regulator/uracil phosphoribosyltransferase PyrR [Ignavibacteriae bacterium]|nr:bifunctional pyr operon transcriptional regulator/uracil phosphoribosyltransferase PyrR [Ignavibacteriota bacterium]
MKKTKLFDAAGLRRTVNRLAHEVVEKNKGVEDLAIVGIRTRGDYLARRLAQKIEEIEHKPVPVGSLDITLYRDDLHGKLEQPQLKSTEILFDVTGKILVLVDDVLFTGRTVRAALNALMDIGRPSSIQLLVLVDRGHRELPIKADFAGKNVPTSLRQQVQVLLEEADKEDGVYLLDAKVDAEEIEQKEKKQ